MRGKDRTRRTLAAVRLATAAVLTLLLPGAAAADTVEVRSGALRAHVETDPWSLRFLDSAGREVVAESPGMRIGYRTSTGWAGATSAASASRDGEAIVA